MASTIAFVPFGKATFAFAVMARCKRHLADRIPRAGNKRLPVTAPRSR